MKTYKLSNQLREEIKALLYIVAESGRLNDIQGADFVKQSIYRVATQIQDLIKQEVLRSKVEELKDLVKQSEEWGWAISKVKTLSLKGSHE